MWEGLKATPSPRLRNDVELERELVILEFYVLWSIGEFIECEGILDPRMIVLLRECKHGVVCVLRQLHGELHDVSYFEQLLALAREVLRRVKVKEAYRIVKHNAEQEMERFCSSSFNPPFEDEKAVSTEDAALSTGL